MIRNNAFTGIISSKYILVSIVTAHSHALVRLRINITDKKVAFSKEWRTSADVLLLSLGIYCIYCIVCERRLQCLYSVTLGTEARDFLLERVGSAV